MFFNSIDFALFLPVVFGLYWFVARNTKQQNILLLLASYFFYGCWDYRFLFLLIFSTALDYYTGIRIHEAESKSRRRIWLWTSILINAGFLGVFKYYNFFVSSFASGILLFGIKIEPGLLDIILPVGISFYTFHGLSYVIDIYNKKISPERNFIVYSVFVSFFPLLVAGPIERATHLLPQILRSRTFDYSRGIDGLRQILWGLFKKIVIADNCAEYANQVFNDVSHQSGSSLIMGALFFTVQIYCDFSGYSDIALGTARLFGIDLIRNFSFPYFSRSIAEFWRRWHISLSSWFRDYLYIPLGGSRGNSWQKIRNVLIIFLVSGFWHGANWTFIVWGLLNAVFILPSVVFGTNRNSLDTVAAGKLFPTIKEILQMSLTFGLTVFAWIFFRAENLHQAVQFIKGIFSPSIFSVPEVSGTAAIDILIVVFFTIEWLGREQQYALQKLGLRWKAPLRYAMYYLIIFLIFWFGGKEQQFIYFQF